MNIIETIEESAREMAIELRDECDGTYVGAEMDKTVSIDGADIDIHVIAFWDRSNWYEFEAKGENFEHRSKDAEFNF